MHQRALKGEVVSAEEDPYEREDGTVDWTRWGCRPWYEPDGSIGGIIVYTEVITERKQTESQLRLQSLVLDQISDRVTVTDLDGVITYVNKAEVETLGYPKEELIGQPIHKYGEDPSKGAAQDTIIRETLEKDHWRGDVVNYTKSGEEIFLDARTQLVRDENGKAVALCGISTDITERKRTEEALRKSESLFKKVFEVLPIGLWIADKNGTLMQGNPTGVKIWGMEPKVDQSEYGVFIRRMPLRTTV